MGLKEDVKLSITTLDKNALDQPSLYEKQATAWAEAIFERDRLKEQLSVKRAQVDEQIRKAPAKYGWTGDKSPTEAWIANQITLDDGIQTLSSKLVEAQYKVNIATAGKEALDHRKKALEILTDLYKGSYFSARSRVSESYDGAIRKAEEAQSEETKARRQRRDRS